MALTKPELSDLRRAILCAADYLKSAAPDIPWLMYEQQLKDALRLFLAREALRLARRAGEGESALEDAAWWRDFQDGLAAVLRPALEDIAYFGLEMASGGAGGIGVNWNLVNRGAADWARTHSAQLVANITDTTRQGVREAVAEWIESGEGLPALSRRIEALADPAGGRVFGARRAELIAQTESTNAFAEANARAWEAAGYAAPAIKPSAHPGCRCYLQPGRMPDGRRVMVWHTVQDDLVCTRPIETPWGKVNGCRDLHQVIVSRGEGMGTKRT